MSLLFEEKKREEKEKMRFAVTTPTSGIISRLEEVAKVVKFDVKKSASKARLQGQERVADLVGFWGFCKGGPLCGGVWVNLARPPFKPSWWHDGDDKRRDLFIWSPPSSVK